MSSINEHMKAWARPITDEEYAAALGMTPKSHKPNKPKASSRKESAESEQK